MLDLRSPKKNRISWHCLEHKRETEKYRHKNRSFLVEGALNFFRSGQAPDPNQCPFASLVNRAHQTLTLDNQRRSPVAIAIAIVNKGENSCTFATPLEGGGPENTRECNRSPSLGDICGVHLWLSPKLYKQPAIHGCGSAKHRWHCCRCSLDLELTSFLDSIELVSSSNCLTSP